MKIMDASLPTPEANLALDEALLDALENGEGAETLRFWESASPFVVVGHGNRVQTEVTAQARAQRLIPILRRCSGGGTVLQGPGCLNYALVLRLPAEGPLSQIGTTNRYVMDRNRAALAKLTDLEVAVQGITDLAVREFRRTPHPAGPGANGATPRASGAEDEPVWLKFSGNAQRRKRHALLFHGAFLLNLDLALLDTLLAHPTQEPSYRHRRPHSAFVSNLGVASAAVKSALAAAWGASEVQTALPSARVERLVAEKYARPEWNLKL